MGMIVSIIRPRDQIPDFKDFTEHDIENIQKTWILPHEQPMDVGEKILYNYFERLPHYQNYFEHFKYSPLLTLKGAPGFRTHAGRMIRVFDNNVQALEKDDIKSEMERIWLPIAKTHYRRTIPQKAFRDFRKVAVDGLQLMCDLTEDECKSYEKFFDNVHHVVFVGLEAMAQRDGKHTK